MLTKRAKRELLDRLHRGFVYSMIGITGIGMCFIGLNLYTMIQNAKEKEKLLFAELEAKDDPGEFPSAPVPRGNVH